MRKFNSNFNIKIITDFSKNEVKLLQKIYEYMRFDKKANMANKKSINIFTIKLSKKAESIYLFAKNNNKEIGLFNLLINNMIDKKLSKYYIEYNEIYGSMSNALKDLIYSMDYEYFYSIKKDLNVIECLRIIHNNTKVMIGEK